MRIRLYTALFVFAVFSVLAVPATTHALSTSWSTTINKDFLYDNLGTWAIGLQRPNINVSYYADVKNLDTGAVFSPGASISVGTRLKFTPRSLRDTDITWFATGYNIDSPYGHWQSGATLPPESDGVNACSPYDWFANTGTITPAVLYAPFSVNPPTITLQHTGTAGLSCSGDKRTCTVTSGGTINSNFVYGSTISRFYFQFTGGPQGVGGSCRFSDIPMTLATRVCTDIILSGSGPFSGMTAQQCDPWQPLPNGDIISIPQRIINFTATVPAPANQSPNTPNITGPTTGVTGVPNTFCVAGTDPDNDTLRYLMDWNNNNSVDQYLPGSGYVSSGTQQCASKTWNVAGSKPFKARAQDSKGAVSGWDTHTITISDPPPTVSLDANRPSIERGDSSTLSWSSTNATSCTSPGFTTNKKTSGSQSVSPSNTTTYKITCTGNGTAINSATVTVIPPPLPTVDLSAKPLVINEGDSSLLTWTTTAAISCTSPDFSTGDKDFGSVMVSPVIDTVYHITCSGKGGSADDSTTVSVTPTPNQAPTADAGGDSTTSTGNSTSFSCSGIDPDGTIASYRWTFGDGTSSNSRNTTHTYNTAGTYTATCTVTDDDGAKDTDSTTATVKDPLQGADLIANKPTLNSGTLGEGNSITFKGITTNQGDTNVTATFDNRFQIDVNNNGTYDTNSDRLNSISGLNKGSSKSVVSFAWSNIPAGTHAVRYCADLPGTDVNESNEGNNCSGKFIFTVTSTPNEPPQVNVGEDEETDDGDPISFSCIATDLDGTIVSYRWNFGDGSTSNSKNTTHTYSTEGVYTATCTATDDDGATGSDTTTVTVNTPLNPPTAGLLADTPSANKGDAVTLNWFSTNADSCSGTNFSTGGATSGSKNITFLQTTTYTVTCSNSVGEASDSDTVSLYAPPTVTISANPVVVIKGGSATIKWDAGNVSECTITGPSGLIDSVTDNDGDWVLSGSTSTGQVTGAQTYTLACTALDGSTPSASVTVRVPPTTFEEF